jgi:glutathione synthase/RimK-type ligase-like ATP-grasp enzyme
MSHKKRIGVVLPPKNEFQKVVEGSGLLPDDIRESFIKGLKGNERIAEVISCNLETAYIKDGKVYEGNICLSDLDLVHWYFVTHLPDSWHILILKTLAQTTRVVPNPTGLLLALDKFYAHTALQSAGIATTRFSLFQASAVNDLADDLCKDGAVLLKPRLGCFGHGIHMAKTARELVDVVQYTQSFSKENLPIFCENFEENDITKWISTTIIGGELIYGYRKKPEKFVDNWKVYDAHRAGGGVDYVDPSPVKEEALKAAKILGCDIVGFDFIYSNAQQKYLIVDENTFPGMYPECFKASGTGSWDAHFLRMILACL